MAEDEPGTEPDDTPSAEDIEKMQAALKKANEEAKKYRLDAKAKDEELAEMKKAQDSSKSEMDKVREQIASLEKRAETAEREALVARVARDKKLPAPLANRLTGSTLEELEEDADSLIEALGIDTSEKDDPDDKSDPPDEKKPPSEQPKTRLKSGNDPEVEPEETDPRKLASRFSHI